MDKMKMKRILVIGLDGATFNVIEPLIQEGRLPVMKRLLREGTSAVLESTPFPHSAPAWTSCFTGVNPGKHGVFGWGVRGDQSSYRFQLSNSLLIKAKTLARLLSEYGKYSVVMNDPVSYPPYPIKGSIISGMLTPQGEGFTFPPELQQELLKAVPDYVTEVSPFDFDLDTHAGLSAYAEALFRAIRARTRAAKLLMDTKQWDFFAVVFTELDRIQHHFWGEKTATLLPLSQKDESLGWVIPRAYEILDESIRLLLEDVPKDTQLFVVSDHGFGPMESTFYMNKFLEERGFLKLRENKSLGKKSLVRTMVRRIPGTKAIYNQLTRLKQRKRLNPLKGSDPRHYRQKMEQWVSEELVEWDQTKAFTDHYGIRINMQGREPKGIVAPGQETQKLLVKIKLELLDLKFPHNGKPVFIRIEEGKNVYHGPFADRGPDLVTFMEVGNPHFSHHVKSCFGESRGTRGGHKKEGIFIGWGMDIHRGCRLRDASIMDIAPTVLYALGIPLTPEMDGVVLDLFEGGLEAEKLSQRQGCSMVKDDSQTEYTPEQEEEIKNRLKGLGYLG
jgi:predicted AlkP superfamily phosphohydrolase/phosphomutase